MATLVGLNALEARRSQERALLATARAVSAAVDLDLARSMEAVEAMALSEPVSVRDWSRTRLRVRRMGIGADAWVVISDLAGAPLLNTVQEDKRQSALPEARPEFANIMATLSDGRPHVSNLFLGPATRRQVVAIDAVTPFARPAMVVSLVLDPKRFLDVAARQSLPADAMITIVDRQRRVLARSREHERYIGALATPVMIDAMAKSPEGVIPSRSLDQQRTIVAYTRSDLSGWTAMVVVPRRTFEAPILSNILGVSAIFVLLAGLSFLAVRGQSRAISGELAALERDARAVGHGEVVPGRKGGIGSFDRVQEALSRASIELDLREKRQKLLINELNHRVKNTLATVQALAAQTFRGAAPEPQAKFEQRLAALGGAHDLLTQTTWTEVDIRDVMIRCGQTSDDRVVAKGPQVMLSPEGALALCMCVHELTTNSLKYGALARDDGRVDVEWSAEPDGALTFSWSEAGGPPVSPPTREGFGTRLMDRLVRNELNGRLQRDYRPEGLVVRGRFLPTSSRFLKDF